MGLTPIFSPDFRPQSDLAVIVACLITWYFIAHSPNEVLIESKEVEVPGLSEQGTHYTPVNRARNHAATGGVPPASR